MIAPWTSSDDVGLFNAIAEPQRREIRYCCGGERVTELARSWDGQPGRPNTMRVLRRSGWCGTARQAARCTALTPGLRPVHEWTAVRAFWNESFDRLDAYVQDSSRQGRRSDDGSDRTGRAAQSATADREIVITGSSVPHGAGVRGLPKCGTCGWWAGGSHTRGVRVRSAGSWNFVMHGPDGRTTRSGSLTRSPAERNRLLHVSPAATRRLRVCPHVRARRRSTRIEMRRVPTRNCATRPVEKYTDRGRQTLSNCCLRHRDRSEGV